jgi:hypothetical protein
MSSCVATSRYIASPSAPPPDCGISCSDKNFSVTLNYVIKPDGPGSWAKGAKWDEYVLTVRNTSSKSATVENIRLVDSKGLHIASGVNPTQLEGESDRMAQAYQNTATQMAVNSALSKALATTSASSLGSVVPMASQLSAIYSMNSQQTQFKDQESIRNEFSRRQLTTFTLAGNSTISGSVFFPVIPNPRALAIEYRVGNEMKALEAPLDKLGTPLVAPAVEVKK